MTSVSYVYPHRNRLELFRQNLDSLRSQTDKDFDVIVVDNSENTEEVKTTLSEYRQYGLRIRAYFIQPWRHPMAHPLDQYRGNYNPALAQNIGVKKSNSDVIVLSSPEVINAKTNVASIKHIFADDKSRFTLGWIGERPASAMPDLYKGISVDQVKALCNVPGGDRTRCRENAWAPENYFIGALRRSDYIKIGGMDEGFLRGMAFEDNCFSERCVSNGITPEFNGRIAGIHLAHSREYQGPAFSDENPNYVLYKKIKGQKVANNNQVWGADDCIVGEF